MKTPIVLALVALLAPAVVPAQTPPTGTPLHTLESHAHPLRPAPPSNGLALGSKAALLCAAMMLGVWLWRKRTARSAPALAAITVRSRFSLGNRSELIVVELEGQRLLLGATPHAIQTLWTLPDEDPGVEPLPASQAPASIESRLAAMLEESDRLPAPAAPTPAIAARRERASRARSTPVAPIEGQAHGLLALRRA